MHNFLGIYNLHFTVSRGHREPMGRDNVKPLSGLRRESGGNEHRPQLQEAATLQ